MVKIVKTNNQYRVTIPPEILTGFGLDPTKDYDWITVQGLAALRERK